MIEETARHAATSTSHESWPAPDSASATRNRGRTQIAYSGVPLHVHTWVPIAIPNGGIARGLAPKLRHAPSPLTSSGPPMQKRPPSAGKVPCIVGGGCGLLGCPPGRGAWRRGGGPAGGLWRPPPCAPPPPPH